MGPHQSVSPAETSSEDLLRAKGKLSWKLDFSSILVAKPNNKSYIFGFSKSDKKDDGIQHCQKIYIGGYNKCPKEMSINDVVFEGGRGWWKVNKGGGRGGLDKYNIM